MNIVKRVRNKEQTKILYSFMKEHPDFANNSLSKKKMNVLWEVLANKLNEAGPPTREMMQWKKVWVDLKYNNKKRRHNQQNKQNDTEKQIPDDSEHSDVEIIDSYRSLSQDITDSEEEENGLPNEIYVEEITHEPDEEKSNLSQEDEDTEKNNFTKQKSTLGSQTKNELLPVYVQAIVENTKIQCEILKSIRESNALKKQELEILKEYQKEKLELKRKKYEMNKKRYGIED